MSDDYQCSDIATYNGDKCSFAQDYCGDDSLANYSELLYCSSPAEQSGVITFLILYLLYLIMLLASTADNYFVIELQTLSSILKLSDDVAGVTLLALGNGAPDVFTAVVGLSQDDFQLALSDLMGGGIFINTAVLGSVLLVTSPPLLEVDAKPFLRDLFMYILCTAGIFFFCLDGVVTQLESLGFIVAYISYIVIVLISPNPLRQASTANTDASASLISNASYESLKDVESLHHVHDPDVDAMSDRPSRQFSYASHQPHHTNLLASDDDHILGYNDVPSVQEDGRLAVFLWYAEWPLSVLRHLSIPSADPFWCRKRRKFTALSPILGFQMAILAVFGFQGFTSKPVSFLFNIQLSVVALVIGILLSVAMWFTTNDESKPSYFPVLVAFAFAMSVVWLDLIANEVVAVLEVFGVMLGISTSVLGLTVLAWGNSVGDLVADTATAKAGQVKTAIASCFGSPLLSALVGLGIALTISTSSDGSLATSIDTQNFVAICTLLGTLFTSGFVFYKYDWRPPREYAYVLFVIYGSFMLVSVSLEALT